MATSTTVEYMRSTNERYKSLGYEPYRWFKADSPPPWQPFSKLVSDARIGLLATAGAYVVGQLAYHYKDDSSTRRIPCDTPDSELRFSHVTENFLEDARRDPGCVLPLAVLRDLAVEGAIGSLPHEVFSCMGGIYSQRRVRDELAPALLSAFKAQAVDAVLLVPMCPVCHQSACIIARHLEGNGIPTMCLGSALDILQSGQPPRATFVDYPLGHTAGKPFDADDKRTIVLAALRGLEEIAKPGEIRVLPNAWHATDEWRMQAGRTRGGDTRRPRDETPQFQHEDDRRAARASGALIAR